jgi:hypothetical protein
MPPPDETGKPPLLGSRGGVPSDLMVGQNTSVSRVSDSLQLKLLRRFVEDETYLQRFVEAAVLEALQHGSALWWERRAEAFDDAAPRLSDFHGQATPDELRAAVIRCRETAEACRQHAQILADMDDGPNPAALGITATDLEAVWAA